MVNFNKSGNIQSNEIDNIISIKDMKTKTLNDNSAWARIYWIDVSIKKEWFSSSAEVDLCIDKVNRYSRMGIIDNFKTSSGIYEFILTYPGLSSSLYNRWTQTSSPNASTVSNYKAITIAWNKHCYGLRLHNNSATKYDCDSSNTWFSPIGEYESWDGTRNIPAADESSQNSTELWVRIDNLDIVKQFKLYDNYISCSDIIEY